VPAVSEAWSSARLSADAMMTVGEMLRDANARSAPGPATELMAKDACE